MPSETTPLLYTHDQTETALTNGIDLVDAIADSPLLNRLDRLVRAELVRIPGPLTREQITTALNDVADRIEQRENPAGWETSYTIWMKDILNLAVCAVDHLLDHPDADLFAVIADAHKDTDLDASAEDDLPEGTERGSDDWNEALYKTVTGWIA